MKIRVTRDSVAAGDDFDAPHQKVFDLPDQEHVFDYLQPLLAEYPLPRISGGKATWVFSSRTPFAVFAQQWPEPRRLSFFPPEAHELDLFGGWLYIHASYLMQQDPDVVVDVLERLTLIAPRTA